MDQLRSSGPEATGTRTDPTALDFTCPRCDQPASERFYGPCAGCRAELRAAYVGLARDVDFEAMEPSPSGEATRQARARSSGPA